MLDNFYSIVNQTITPELALITVRFNEKHPIFQGHFPTIPIVPGACLMEMACELSSFVLQKKLQVSAAANIKFLQVIYPDKTPTLVFELQIMENDDCYGVKCRIHDEVSTYATMKLTLCNSVC